MQSVPRLQKKHPGEGLAWDSVWSSRGLMKIVAIGRAIYNRGFFRELRPHLSADTDMVELGCGTASLGMLLSRSVRSYTGIDCSERQTLKTRERCARFPNMTIILRDLYDGSSHGTYDLVWSQGLVEHFEDPVDVIIKHLEYCKPGGTVVISVPRSGGYMDRWHRWSERSSWIPWPWTHQRFFSKNDLEDAMAHVPRERYRSFTIEDLKPAFAGIILLRIDAPIR